MIANLLKYLLVFVTISALVLLSIFGHANVTQLHFQGEKVSIDRDDHGVPSIVAPSFRSAMYAIGYATAEDRLFQMGFKRVIGTGRISQFVGESALSVDKMFRELNFKGWSKKVALRLKNEDPTEYENLNSYAKGVNDYVASLKALPIDFQLLGLEWENWTVEDTFLVFYILKWSQAGNHAEEYIRSNLLSNYTKEQIDIMLPYEHHNWFLANKQSTIIDDAEIKPEYRRSQQAQRPFTPQQVQDMLKVGLLDYIDSERGSNSWVISGELTESGHPLIANDPHLDNVLPNQWYQVRVQYRTAKGVHRGSWASMAGLPLPVGKSDYISIAVTTYYGDVQDLYKEEIKDEKYFLDGKWIPLNIRTEVIKVKGKESQKYQVSSTHRGPLIRYIGHVGALYQIKENISLVWVGFDDNFNTYTSTLHLGEVSTHEQWLSWIQLKSEHMANMNLLYSTSDGHIGYQMLGRYPIRGHPHEGMYVKDGTTSANDWQGYIPPESRLSVQDPERGYIVTANNKPAGKLYQAGSSDISIYTARAIRITEMIHKKIYSGKKFTLEDMISMQLDTKDVYCQALLPHIAAALPASHRVLSNFDCDFTSGSHQATVYQVFLYKLAHLLNPKPEAKFHILAMHGFISYMQNYITQAQDSIQRKTTLEKAWEQMLRQLEIFYKTNDTLLWKWSDYHRDFMAHRPFGSVPILNMLYTREFQGRGNMHTVNVGKMGKQTFGDFRTNHRANLRTIISFYENSLWIIDGGANEKFYSDHYCDQLQLFKQDKYLPMELSPSPVIPDQL